MKFPGWMYWICSFSVKEKQKVCVEDISLYWRLNLHPLSHREARVTVLLRPMPLANVCVCVMLAQCGGMNPGLWILDFLTRLMWRLSKGTAGLCLASPVEGSKARNYRLTKRWRTCETYSQRLPKGSSPKGLQSSYVGCWCVNVAAVKSTGQPASACAA